MGGGGVEVFAVVQRLFAEGRGFAQGTRDGVYRTAEGGIIIGRGGGKSLLRSGQFSFLVVPDVFRALKPVANCSDENGRFLRLLVDDDELDGLTDAVGRLATIKGEDVTSLPGFEASFSTKAGLRVIAHSDRANGAVLTHLQFEDSPRIPLSSVQIQQLGVLLQQGRKKLDALKAGN